MFGIGLENPADQADVLVGSGTKFTTELKIGDQINFIDDSGDSVTRIVQNIESDTRLQTFLGLGTATATSRQLIITVAASAPALYYWCSAHSGMGGAINTNATFGSNPNSLTTLAVDIAISAICSDVGYRGH